MAKRVGYTSKIREFRAALGLDRKQFAKKLGVGQTAVSAWERAMGGYAPSSETYVRLGNWASREKRNEDAFWFWQEAGLDRRALLSAAGRDRKVLKDRAASIEPGEIITVPHTQKISEGAGSPSLRFPYSMVRNPATTTYVRLSDTWYSPLFESGDVLVIDESETDFRKLEGSCVAFYRSEEDATVEVLSAPARNQRFADEIAKGQEVSMGKVERSLTTRSGVFAAWLLKDEKTSGISVKVPSRLGPLLRDDTLTSPALLDVGATILGRVLAWIPSSGREQREQETKKK